MLDAVEGRSLLARAEGARRAGHPVSNGQGADSARQARRAAPDLGPAAVSGDRVREWVRLPRGVGGHGRNDSRRQARGERHGVTWFTGTRITTVRAPVYLARRRESRGS